MNSLDSEINPLILEKLEETVKDAKIRAFLIRILNIEKDNLDTNERRWKEDYHTLLRNIERIDIRSLNVGTKSATRPSLQIKSLEIKNFRQYRDAKIEFSLDPNKPFTIISGANGSGKTNIMNAITWCLYGKEKHMTKDNKERSVINSNALESCKVNQTITLSVKLEVAMQGRSKYLISREVELHKHDEGIEYTPYYGLVKIPESCEVVEKDDDGLLFQELKSHDGGWKTTPFELGVKQILPEKLSNYFLFDGEQLEEFFEQTDSVKKGIEDISQIAVIEKTIEHLSKLPDEIRRNIKGLDSGSQGIQGEIGGIINGTGEYKIKKGNAKNLLKKIDDELLEISKFLKNHVDASDLQKEKERLEKEIKRERDEQKKLKSEQIEYVLEKSDGVYLLSTLEKVRSMIEQDYSTGKIPADMKDYFVKALLNTGECICGSNISEGMEARSKVEKQLESSAYSQIENLCNDVHRELTMTEKDIGNIIHTLNDQNNKMSDSRGNEEELKEQLKNVNVKLEKIPEKEIQKKKKREGELELERDRLVGNLAVYENEMEELERRKKELEKELDKANENKEIYQREIEKASTCERANVYLTKSKEELLKNVQGNVQKYTKKYFLELIWKKNTFRDISIDEKYELSVIDKNGEKSMSLSKGEKLVLALSFISSLRKITGFGFPLVIDTPLGRVSGEHRENIAVSLPVFLENTQVSLLVTDSEYNADIISDDGEKTFPSVSQVISYKVGKKYLLEYDDQIQTTEVKND